MLVLAGPGSGKTAVITQRTLNLIQEEGIDPRKILVITFTRAAAMEMKKRFEGLYGEKSGVTFGTFHSVFFAILKNAYHYSAANIITQEQKYQFMREILSYHHLDYQDEGELVNGILAEISTIKNGQLDLAHFYSGQCSEEIFRKIYEAYDRRLKRSKLIDFDDMLVYIYELFTQRPDILALWQNAFPYIMIDEFQDINRIQYEIVKMLAAPANNLFIVGDDDQSIYRFRGSKPEIMLGFTRDYPQAKQVLLDTNYRCGKYIVETAGNLISYNKERFPKEIHASSKDMTPVRYITFENRRDENLYITREIKRQLQQGAPAGEFAVLYRTNTQPRMITEQLMEYDLDFRMKDRFPNIYDHWIAKDLFTYIRISQGSRAREDFLQVMNRPKRYLSRDCLCSPRVDFAEWIRMYDDQPWMAERIQKLESDLRLIGRMNPYAAINYIRKGMGYQDFIKEFAQYKGLDEGELMDVLEEIHSGAKGFADFAAWQEHIRIYQARLKQIEEEKYAQPDAITLATLHGSKGLEFDCVFLIDCNEGIVPYKKASLDKEIEEERRLFYVGMTRARKQLYICSVKSLHDKNTAISRFVTESKEASGKK